MTEEKIKEYLKAHTVLSNSGTHVIWAEDIDKISKGLVEMFENKLLHICNGNPKVTEILRIN